MQGINRVVRIGQEREVLIFSVYVKGSVDARVYQLQLEKAQMAVDVVKDAKMDVIYTSLPHSAVASSSAANNNNNLDTAMFGGAMDEILVEKLSGEELQPRRNKKKRASKTTVYDEDSEHDVYSFSDSFDRARSVPSFPLGAPLLQLEYSVNEEQQTRNQFPGHNPDSPEPQHWDIYQNDPIAREQRNRRVEEYMAQAGTLLEQEKQQVEVFQARAAAMNTKKDVLAEAEVTTNSATEDVLTIVDTTAAVESEATDVAQAKATFNWARLRQRWSGRAHSGKQLLVDLTNNDSDSD